jgi:hypothetical protein
MRYDNSGNLGQHSCREWGEIDMARSVLGYVFIGIAVISAGLGVKSWVDQPAVT